MLDYMETVDDDDLELYINRLSAKNGFGVNIGESGNVLGFKDYTYIKHLHLHYMSLFL
jgi:hypothetical protein